MTEVFFSISELCFFFLIHYNFYKSSFGGGTKDTVHTAVVSVRLCPYILFLLLSFSNCAPFVLRTIALPAVAAIGTEHFRMAVSSKNGTIISLVPGWYYQEPSLKIKSVTGLMLICPNLQ